MFIGEFLKNVPTDFKWQQTPLQIYPLHFLRNRLKLPLPVLKRDYNFLFYVKEGSLVNSINNDTYTCGADSLIFVSVGNVTALQKVSPDLEGYFILIEDQTMSALFNRQDLLKAFMIDPVVKLKTEESEWVYGLCQLLNSELLAEFPDVKVGVSLLQALFGKLLHLSVKIKSVSRTQQIAIHYKQLVYRHFVEQKRISFYADLLNVSPNYLSKCVKTFFGKSSKEILMDAALVHGQVLLADSTKSVADISFELQFEDPSYFTRIFKNFTGFTPSEYRVKIMQDLS